MNALKIYIISIIITSAIIQIGGMFITSESNKKLYQLMGSIILILTLLKIPQKIDFEHPKFLSEKQYSSQETAAFVTNDFVSKTSDMIKKDINNVFLVECVVDVVTTENYDKIIISVYGNFDNKTASQIEKHIYQKYCTNNDEVRIVCDG